MSRLRLELLERELNCLVDGLLLRLVSCLLLGHELVRVTTPDPGLHGEPVPVVPSLGLDGSLFLLVAAVHQLLHLVVGVLVAGGVRPRVELLRLAEATGGLFVEDDRRYVFGQLRELLDEVHGLLADALGLQLLHELVVPLPPLLLLPLEALVLQLGLPHRTFVVALLQLLDLRRGLLRRLRRRTGPCQLRRRRLRARGELREVLHGERVEPVGRATRRARRRYSRLGRGPHRFPGSGPVARHDLEAAERDRLGSDSPLFVRALSCDMARLAAQPTWPFLLGQGRLGAPAGLVPGLAAVDALARSGRRRARQPLRAASRVPRRVPPRRPRSPWAGAPLSSEPLESPLDGEDLVRGRVRVELEQRLHVVLAGVLVLVRLGFWGLLHLVDRSPAAFPRGRVHDLPLLLELHLHADPLLDRVEVGEALHVAEYFAAERRGQDPEELASPVLERHRVPTRVEVLAVQLFPVGDRLPHVLVVHDLRLVLAAIPQAVPAAVGLGVNL